MADPNSTETNAPVILKRCYNCKKNLPASEFWKYRHGTKGLQSNCKSCAREYDRRRRVRLPLRHRKHELKRKFGISEKEYEELFCKQNGLCAICGNRPEDTRRHGKKAKFFDIDHCHATGEIRGLLCSRCNRVIGQFDDDPKLLRLALAYLER